jgi:ribonuclease T2
MKRFSVTILTLFFVLCFGTAEAKKSHHGGKPAVNFDYYLLALSWSPEFCTTPAGHKTSKSEQCHKPLGFVVHGLWPQFNNGKWPQNCNLNSPKNVPADIAAIALNAEPPMPPGDPGLLSHEWTTHGTCSGLDQKGYFTKIKEAAEKVKIPDVLKQPSSPVEMNFDTIVQNFVQVNPGLEAKMLDSNADNKGNISEIHVCFSKQLVFQPCNGSTNKDKGGNFLPVNQ